MYKIVYSDSLKKNVDYLVALLFNNLFINNLNNFKINFNKLYISW